MLCSAARFFRGPFGSDALRPVRLHKRRRLRLALLQFGNPHQRGLQLARQLANLLLQGRVRLRQCAHLGTQTSFSTSSASASSCVMATSIPHPDGTVNSYQRSGTGAVMNCCIPYAFNPPAVIPCTYCFIPSENNTINGTAARMYAAICGVTSEGVPGLSVFGGQT